MNWYLNLCHHISADIPKDTCFAIACSGGVDSMFLVRILLKCLDHTLMTVIIIDHRLVDSNYLNAKETATVISGLGIKHCILTWVHGQVLSGIEEKARIARYDLIKDFCLKNDIKYVVLAHHIDDKIETFFMNAMRGVGVCGLTSMRKVMQNNGITYIRPMLYLVEKHQIVNYMSQNNIPWFEDQSNTDDTFQRNRMRKMLKLTSNEKQNILTTIKNLEAEYDNKMLLVYDLIQKYVISVNMLVKIPIDSISVIPKVHFRDFILTIIFEKIYRYARWEIRESGINKLRDFIYSCHYGATFFKCFFYKKNGILHIVPEYQRLSEMTADFGSKTNWNNIILCCHSEKYSIVPLGKLEVRTRKALQIKQNFLEVAHLPAFVFNQRIAVPHLGILLDDVKIEIT